MIKNVLIIGDSHTDFLCNSNDENFIEQKGVARYKAKENVHFIWKHAKVAYNIDYNIFNPHISEIYDKIDKSWIVMPYLGEIDIRWHIPKHNNAADVVDIYIKNTVEYFKNTGCKIKFIEPTPQTDVSQFLKNDPEFYKYNVSNETLRERVNIHINFMNHMVHKSKIYGIEEPLLNIFDSKIIKSSQSYDGSHMSKEYNSILLNKILSSVLDMH